MILNFKYDKGNLSIKNQAGDAGDVATIDIDGVIGWDNWWEENPSANTKEKMKKVLKAIGNIKTKKIVVNINSYGGDVNHGLAIHDMLVNHSAEVETIAYGYVASIATVIHQAGDVRKVSGNSLYLIHEAWTVAIGNKGQVNRTVKDLGQADKVLARVYANRSGKPVAHFEEIMGRADGDGEWLTADEVVEAGLADEVKEVVAKRLAANFDKSILNRMGVPNLPKNKLQKMDLKALILAAVKQLGKEECVNRVVKDLDCEKVKAEEIVDGGIDDLDDADRTTLQNIFADVVIEEEEEEEEEEEDGDGGEVVEGLQNVMSVLKGMNNMQETVATINNLVNVVNAERSKFGDLQNKYNELEKSNNSLVEKFNAQKAKLEKALKSGSGGQAKGKLPKNGGEEELSAEDKQFAALGRIAKSHIESED